MGIKAVKQFLKHLAGKIVPLFIESGQSRRVFVVSEIFQEFMVHRAAFHRDLEMVQSFKSKFTVSGKINVLMF